MEMLAEMEGSEEALMGLNNAEHKPEDEMQTDEWMYELKHRKSWATGMYVPSVDKNGDGEKLTLDSTHFEDGGRAPPSWQEHLSPIQVDLVIKSWTNLPRENFGKAMHEKLLKHRTSSEPLNNDEQVQKIILTVDTAVKQILNVANVQTVATSLNSRIEEYQLPVEEALLIFGDELLVSISTISGNNFTTEEREAWGSAYKFIAGLVADFEPEK